MTPSPPPRIVSTIRAPSVVGRALVSVAFIGAFYLLTIGFALVLLSLPVLFGVASQWRRIRELLVITAICWVPAFLFLASLLGIRRSRSAPGGRELTPAESPELFALLRELAAHADTAAPTRVMLEADFNLAVTEHGGVRYLILGAPLLARATVDELRAGLAHELGHFAFGDTRLGGFVVYAHDMFVAMVSGTRRSAFADTGIGSVEIGFQVAQKLANVFVDKFAKVYFAVTHRSSRRAELAADELAAKLAGPAATEALLRRTAREAVLVELYRRSEVRAALHAGAMPTDPLAGFETYAARSGEVGLVAEVDANESEQKTDLYDTHPSLQDRLAALAAVAPSCPPSPFTPDPRKASALVHVDLEAFVSGSWLDEAASWLPRESVVARLAWAHVPAQAYAPNAMKEARGLAAKLFQAHPSATTLTRMLSAVVGDLVAGRLEAMLGFLHPELLGPEVQTAPGEVRASVFLDVGAMALGTLLLGAMLERGAEMLPSLGDPSMVVRWNGVVWHVHTLARDAMSDATAAGTLERLARDLVASEV